VAKTYDCHTAACCCSASKQAPASTRTLTSVPWLVQMQTRAKDVVDSCYPLRAGSGRQVEQSAQHSTAQHSTEWQSKGRVGQGRAGQGRAALPPDPSRLSAQRSKLQPRVGVLSHRQHQRTDRQQSLPHLHIPLNALQSASPHLTDLNSVQVSCCLVAVTQSKGVAEAYHLFQLCQLLDSDHITVGSLVAFSYQGG